MEQFESTPVTRMRLPAKAHIQSFDFVLPKAAILVARLTTDQPHQTGAAPIRAARASFAGPLRRPGEARSAGDLYPGRWCPARAAAAHLQGVALQVVERAQRVDRGARTAWPARTGCRPAGSCGCGRWGGRWRRGPEASASRGHVARPCRLPARNPARRRRGQRGHLDAAGAGSPGTSMDWPAATFWREPMSLVSRSLASLTPKRLAMDA